MQFTNYYAFLALDIARERTAEANAQRLAALAHRGELRPNRVRRAVARVAHAVAHAADARSVETSARSPLTTH